MLRPGTTGDLGFIRALTLRPEFQPFITDEDEAALQAYLDAPDCELLIWAPDAIAAGFAILCEIGHPSGRVELMRLALDAPGKGQGRAFLRALLDRAFDHHGAARVWLDCSGENTRAQRLYLRAGLRHEGTLRQHWFRPALGRSVDMLLYGMLRSEWETLEPLAARA